MIPHGAFAHLAELPAAPPPFATDKRVVLFFGLLRPYKGLDVLLRGVARHRRRRAVDRRHAAHGHRRAVGGRRRRTCASSRASSATRELPAYFARADLVVLPYREIDQSGVLFTALAFGKPLLVSATSAASPSSRERGAAHAVAPGDAAALHDALASLLGDARRAGACWASARARWRAASTRWDEIARRTLALYERLLSG